MSVNGTSVFRERYGPWALVAGASVGLGAAFARELASRGLSIVAVARRADAVRELCAELRERYGVQAQEVVLDLARSDLADAIERETAELEIGLVVYNAAYPNEGRFLDRDLADHLKVIDTNCRGPIVLAHRFGGRMRARGRGGIILMSSLTAFNGSPGITTYGATKGFNLIFGEGLWYELAAHGIDVTVCCAGAIRTPNYGEFAKQGGFAPPALTPEQVARTAVRALGRRGVVIPGAFNRVASLLMRRLLPRATTVRVMGKAVEGVSAE